MPERNHLETKPRHPIRSRVWTHGVYKDNRQKTGYIWYCDKIDWRFAISRAEVDLPFIYCPGCAMPCSEPHFERVMEGKP